MKKVDIFFPPGVQQKLFARCGTSNIPLKANSSLAAKIDALWKVRNKAPEHELEEIDSTMEAMVVAAIKI